jgi:hypothetical protein
MFEIALIAVCIIAGVAYACGRVGYRLGAKSAARRITRVFQREITSKDNELDEVEGRLRRRKYIDLALDRLAQQLLQAAMGEGERQFQAALVPKPGEASVIMKGKGNGQSLQTRRVAKIAKPTGSKLVKGPAESEKFVRWKAMKNSEENS